uniref:Putative secreted protein n=1 Tax=Ixodes ricinus TaxID=34613 RepID=A0A6B0UYC8_IXORI
MALCLASVAIFWYFSLPFTRSPGSCPAATRRRRDPEWFLDVKKLENARSTQCRQSPPERLSRADRRYDACKATQSPQVPKSGPSISARCRRRSVASSLVALWRRHGNRGVRGTCPFCCRPLSRSTVHKKIKQHDILRRDGQDLASSFVATSRPLLTYGRHGALNHSIDTII